MRRAILAASVFSGLIIPATPQLFVPAAPAIVKADHLELTRHLLAIPIPVGVPASMQRPPPSYLSVAGSAASQTAETYTWTHTIEATATCIIVAFGGMSGVPVVGNLSCTVNGVAMTQAVVTSASTKFKHALFYMFNPPTGAQTIVATASGTIDRHGAAHSVTVAGAASVDASNSGTGTTSASAVLTTSKKTLVIAGATVNTSVSTGSTMTISSPASSTNVREVTSTYITRQFTIAYKTPVQDAGTVTVTVAPTNSSTVHVCAVALAA
jgi:hypothetical protein